MRTEHLRESGKLTLDLTEEQAETLRRMGDALASKKQWWGAGEGEDETSNTKVLRCDRIASGRYTIKVSDVVGVVGLGDLQLIIAPKIPLPHLLHLLSAADQVPRLEYERSRIGVDDDFVTVIARWFIRCCEALLRNGLISDYGRVTADLTCARGRIHPVETARSVMVGRPVIRCDYDRLGEDTSLNRVLKAATVRLSGLRSLPLDQRERGRRIAYRFSDVGDLRSDDLRVRPDALSRRYCEAHSLALAILASTGLSLDLGDMRTWTFLFRTPEAVEEGVRNSLRAHLDLMWRVRKSAMLLGGDRNRSLNADLVFGDVTAVGDVKYRRNDDGEIKRAELNQITTFATGYGADKAAVISFGPAEVGEEVHVGRVRVNGFNWDYGVEPEDAAVKLAGKIESWLAC